MKRKAFALVELVIVMLVIAVLAVAVFVGGSVVVRRSQVTTATSDLHNFSVAVESTLSEVPECLSIKNNDTTEANLDRFIKQLQKNLAREYALNLDSQVTKNGNTKIMLDTANTGTYLVYESKKTDPWGNPYYFILDCENRYDVEDSEYYVTVVSSGPNSITGIGRGLHIDGDDVFLLGENHDSHVKSVIINASEVSSFTVGTKSLRIERNSADNSSDIAGYVGHGATPTVEAKVESRWPFQRPSSPSEPGSGSTKMNPRIPTFSPSSIAVLPGETLSTTITRDGTGTITAVSSDPAVASVEVDGNTIKVTGVADGTATIAVSVAGDIQYKAIGPVSIPVTVSSTLVRHTVTFDTGGSALVADGATVDRPTDPERTGYTFNGWSAVPDGYTQLDYVESDGSQYINTGILPNINTVVRGNLKVNGDGTGGYNMSGTAGGDYPYCSAISFGVYLPTTSDLASVFIGDTVIGQANLPQDNNFHIYYASSDIRKIDNATESTNNATSYVDSTSRPFYLFAYNESGTIKYASQSIKWFKFNNKDGEALADYVPARRDSDDALGMYDLVSESFISSTGTLTGGTEATYDFDTPVTSDFTLYAKWTRNPGEEVAIPAGYTELEYLESTGTDYIDLETKMYNGFKFEGDVYWTSLTDDSVFIGATVGHTNRDYFGAGSNTWNCYILGAGGYALTNDGVKPDLNNKHHYDVSIYPDNYYIKVDNNNLQITTHEQMSSPNNNSYNIYLFADNYMGSPGFYSNVRIYGDFRLYDEHDSIVAKMYPVRRNSDNKLGMYDTVRDMFLPMQGGNGIAGPVADPVVTFMDGDSIYTTKTTTHGGTVSAPTEPTKDGYIFKGWSVVQQYNMPSGVTQLQYIESTGSQYIDTEVATNDSLVIETSLAFPEMYHDDGDPYADFGGTVGTNDGSYMGAICIHSNNGLGVTFYGEDDGDTYPANSYTKTAKMGYDNLFHEYYLANGEQRIDRVTGDVPARHFMSSLNWYAFGRNQGYSPYLAYAKAQIRYITITNHGTVVRRMVAARRDSDGKLGLYDLANNKFYSDNNGGNFTAGPALSNFDFSTAINGDTVLYAVWKRAVSTTVPAGYTQLDYLESDGSSYIITDLILTSGFRAIGDVMKVAETPVHNMGGILGAQDSTSNNRNWFGFHGSGWGAGKNGWGENGTANLNQLYHVEANTLGDNPQLSVDNVDVPINIASADRGTASNTGHLGLFCVNYREQTEIWTMPIRIYGPLYVYSSEDTSALEACFIPAKRNSDGAPGMYDTVADKFYTNAGSGSFKMGGIKVSLPSGYTQLSYLEGDGEAYIDTELTGLTGGFRVDAKIEAMDLSQASYGIIGCHDPAYWSPWMYARNYIGIGHGGFTDANGFTLGITHSYVATYPVTIRELYELDASTLIGNEYVKVNGGDALPLVHDDTGDGGRSSRTNFLYAVNLWGTPGTKFVGRIYDTFKVYTSLDDSQLVAEFVPARRESDGELGMYDVVRDRFFTNVGEGSFIAEDHDNHGELPSGYTRLSYLEGDGQAYIDTGLSVLTNGFRVEGRVASLDIESDRVIFGSMNRGYASDWAYARNFVGMGKVSSIYGFSLDQGNYSIQSGVPYNINASTILDSNFIKVNGGDNLSMSYIDTGSGGRSRRSNYLFALNYDDGASFIFKGRIYDSFKVYTSLDDSTLIAEFVPARRDSDGVLGMYDVVRNRFYTNAGSGSFTTTTTNVALPSGYTRLSSIRFVAPLDAGCAIHTGVLVEDSPNFEVKAGINLHGYYKLNGESYAVPLFHLGYLSGAMENNYNIFINSWSEGCYYFVGGYGNSYTGMGRVLSLNQDYNFSFRVRNGSYNISSERETISGTLAQSTGYAGRELTILSEHVCNETIRYVQIYNNGSLVREYIPARHGDEVGLYETMQGTFHSYTPTASIEFEA